MDSTLEQTLARHFGFDAFRPGQREAMEVILAGRPALAVFPTGSGKSLCYQLPALLLDGLTLVVSPLIALMKDQVEALQARGIAAARLDSTLESNEVREIYQGMDEGSLRLLYVAPERLANEGFLRKLRRTRIDLLAIDEAHCISEWGHNFRPDYLKLAQLGRALQIARVLCLTATATPKVAEDIRRHFAIAEADHIQTGFRRPNLSYHVTPCPAADRLDLLVSRLKSHPPGATIVYVTLQHTAESVAKGLKNAGFTAKAYHAGLRDEHRAAVQDAFMSGECPIVVATIAFGMGIDKADIRSVYHYNLPKSLENYSQETGRAGRDGEPARCEVLACGDDRIVLENFVYGDTPSPRALKSLVERLLLQGETFDISRYELSGSLDIRPLVVATALTYLELSGVLIPRGPFYAGYRFQFLRDREKVLAGHTDERKRFLNRVFDASKKGRSWFTIDLHAAAQSIDEPEDVSSEALANEDVSSEALAKEERIRKALGYLADLGDIRLQPFGLRHAYELGPDRPPLSEIVADLQGLFGRREDAEVARLDLVLRFCQHDGCLSTFLLDYFGEEGAADCGSCSQCSGEEARPLPCALSDDLSPAQVELVHHVHGEGHPVLRQPRQLTRFLCGITSPATSRERLNRHDAFGALAEVPFLTVLAQAETLV